MVYLGATLLVALLVATTLDKRLPPFFIAGQGRTPIRQAVLAFAVTAFAVAATLTLVHHSASGASPVLYCGLGLVLLAAGLGAVFLQPSVGSLLGWTGRAAQYMTGLWFLLAFRAIARKAQRLDVTPEDALAQFFRESEANYRALVESIPDGVIVLDGSGLILLWNRGAEALLGILRADSLGRTILDLLPDGPLHDCLLLLISRWSNGEGLPGVSL